MTDKRKILVLLDDTFAASHAFCRFKNRYDLRHCTLTLLVQGRNACHPSMTLEEIASTPWDAILAFTLNKPVDVSSLEYAFFANLGNPADKGDVSATIDRGAVTPRPAWLLEDERSISFQLVDHLAWLEPLAYLPDWHDIKAFFCNRQEAIMGLETKASRSLFTITENLPLLFSPEEICRISHSAVGKVLVHEAACTHCDQLPDFVSVVGDDPAKHEAELEELKYGMLFFTARQQAHGVVETWKRQQKVIIRFFDAPAQLPVYGWEDIVRKLPTVDRKVDVIGMGILCRHLMSAPDFPWQNIDRLFDNDPRKKGVVAWGKTVMPLNEADPNQTAPVLFLAVQEPNLLLQQVHDWLGGISRELLYIDVQQHGKVVLKHC